MLSHQKSSDMYKYENRNEYTLSSTIKTQFNQYNQNIKRKKSDEASTPSETERIHWSNANHNPTPSPVKATPTTTPPPPTNPHPRKPDLDLEWCGFCKIFLQIKTKLKI
jgi:hypothetical protein